MSTYNLSNGTATGVKVMKYKLAGLATQQSIKLSYRIFSVTESDRKSYLFIATTAALMGK
jgi:hypothetical protein